LQHDGPRIELSGDEVHAGAVHGVVRLEHAPVSVQAPVSGQERGVNVEHSAEITRDERPRQNAHEACQRDHVAPVRLENRRDRYLERRARAHAWITTPRAPARTSPTIVAVSARAARNFTAAAACSGGTMTTMPSPQLKVRYISADSMLPAFCSQSNTGSRCQLRRSSTASRPSGSTRGMLSVSPPPVMCASACTGMA